jgi:hypothetical protein
VCGGEGAVTGVDQGQLGRWGGLRVDVELQSGALTDVKNFLFGNPV